MWESSVLTYFYFLFHALGRSAPGFVQAALADIAHPLDDVVVAVVKLRLEHLQVAHLEARRRERNLENRKYCHFGFCSRAQMGQLVQGVQQ